jgi:arylsulfatase A-like enzyme
MQMSVPEVMDLRQEPRKLLDLYGAKPGASSFANNCLLARRLVERGVRFVQLYDWGWDTHGTGPGDDIVTALPRKCRETDRPVAALLKDLKARGLLDETLVIWGGEFGRTSMNEARGGSKYLGRDHHPHCFTIWMAGAGIKPGVTHGATDELGYFITEGRTSVPDLQATILHLLGLDAWKLTYPFQGLQQRLIGPEGKAEVRREILA